MVSLGYSHDQLSKPKSTVEAIGSKHRHDGYFVMFWNLPDGPYHREYRGDNPGFGETVMAVNPGLADAWVLPL